MEGIVYHIFNTRNGKAYVGQTWDTLENRLIGHRQPGPMLIQRAIQKHGLGAFVATVLTRCSNQADLDAAEIAFIKEMRTMHPEGYNLREGGAHGRHSEESRRRMSEAHKGQAPNSTSWKKGNLPWNKGGTFSAETRAKMRQVKLGIARSEAARKAVSEGMKRANLGLSRLGKKRGPYKKRATSEKVE